MRKLFEKYVANGFQDFKGSSVSANIIIKEECINEMIAELLRTTAEPAVSLVKKVAVRTNGSVTLEFELRA